MSTPRTRRFPGDRYPSAVTRCQICDRTSPTGPGSISEVPAEHYRRAHPEALSILAE